MNIKALLPPVFAMYLFLAPGSVAFAQNPAETDKRDEQRAEQADSDDSEDTDGFKGSWFEGSAAPAKETPAEEQAGEDVVESLDPVEPDETTESSGQARPDNGQGSRSFDDRCLASTIEAVLDVDRAGRSSELTIDAQGGVVSLTGTLQDQASIEHIRDLISGVKGVNRVDTSGLTISGKRPDKD